MKIRNGFVSNSSSSSFIVKVKKPGFCKTDIGKIIGFLSLLETASFGRDDSEETHIIASKKEFVLEKIDRDIDENKQYYAPGFSDLEVRRMIYSGEYKDIESLKNALKVEENVSEFERELLKAKEKVEEVNEDKFDIIFFELSYHDEVINNAMNFLEENKELEVLYGRN